MKRFAFVLILAFLAASCGTDNQSRVRFELDEQGCLMSASDYDEAAISATDEGFRTANFNWWCADYANIEEGISVSEKRVTLTFTGPYLRPLMPRLKLNILSPGGANPIQ